MAATIIDGKQISAKMRTEIKTDVDKLKEKGITPGLAVILVGEDPASHVYVRQKELACQEAGLFSDKHALLNSATQEELLTIIDRLNNDEKIDGILVQLPLPKHIDETTVLRAVAPDKDVDGFHPINVGKLSIGEKGFYPCTPYGVIHLLEKSGVNISGKDAVVVGRSNIVGKPAAMLLLNHNATVTICHSKTHKLAEHTKRADILVVAVGAPRAITKDMVKEGAVVIDVGVNREGGKLVGDVDFEGVKEVASQITPVPGGVGPMTITMLLHNTVQAAKLRRNLAQGRNLA